MDRPIKAPRKFAIAGHPDLPASHEEVAKICAYLRDLGAEEVLCGSIYDETLRRRVQAGEFDVLVALGGDGTILRASHLCATVGVPILGINLGHMGFLTEVPIDQWRELLPRVLNKQYRIEERMMLWAEHQRDGRVLDAWDVLNEVVVCRGQFVRPIRLQASVDGYILSQYVADGLIAATATGSTAYALAVGGPIMPPELRNILIVPVAPHLSLDRAIILQEGAGVSITVESSHQAVLSVDGHAPIAVENGDVVHVSASPHSVRFIRFSDPGYFYYNLSKYMEQNPITGGTL